MDTEAPLHVSFYTQTRLHTDTFTHRSFCKEKSLHRGACTQTSPHTGNFCLHTEVFTQRSWQIFTQRTFYTEKSLHTRICTQKLYRKRFCTQMLLHSDYMQMFFTNTLLHREAVAQSTLKKITQSTFYTHLDEVYSFYTLQNWSSTLIGVRPLSQFFCDLDVQRSFLARRFHRAFYNRIFLSSGPLTLISCKRVRRAEQNSHFTTRFDIRRQDLHRELPRSNQNLHSGHALGFPTRRFFAGGCARPNQSQISRLGPTRTISAKGH